jgi:MazG family protein
MKKQIYNEDISKLLEIITALRDPDRGCSWDQEQTFATIGSYTIEEAYEVVDAIAREDMEDLKDELGDLLLQVVYHSHMAEEEGFFAFSDVIEAICTKMIRRHPHVFGNEQVDDAKSQTEAWETLKAAEKGVLPDSVLDGVPLALPALTRSMKLGRRAARVGFDWPDWGGARDKVDEELEELNAAVHSADYEAIVAEMGDTLFSLVNLCRHLNVEPEACLSSANDRFEKRFRNVERNVKNADGDWAHYSTDALEGLWHKAKEETD